MAYKELEWTEDYRAFTASSFAAGIKLLGREFPALLILVTHPKSGTVRVPSSPAAMLRLLKHQLNTKQLPKGLTLKFSREKTTGVYSCLIHFDKTYVLGFSFVGPESAPRKLKFFWRWMPKTFLVHAEGLLNDY